jgi:hypothetical protein
MAAFWLLKSVVRGTQHGTGDGFAGAAGPGQWPQWPQFWGDLVAPTRMLQVIATRGVIKKKNTYIYIYHIYVYIMYIMYIYICIYNVYIYT